MENRNIYSFVILTEKPALREQGGSFLQGWPTCGMAGGGISASKCVAAGLYQRDCRRYPFLGRRTSNQFFIVGIPHTPTGSRRSGILPIAWRRDGICGRSRAGETRLVRICGISYTALVRSDGQNHKMSPAIGSDSRFLRNYYVAFPVSLKNAAVPGVPHVADKDPGCQSNH